MPAKCPLPYNRASCLFSYIGFKSFAAVSSFASQSNTNFLLLILRILRGGGGAVSACFNASRSGANVVCCCCGIVGAGFCGGGDGARTGSTGASFVDENTGFCDADVCDAIKDERVGGRVLRTDICFYYMRCESVVYRLLLSPLKMRTTCERKWKHKSKITQTDKMRRIEA